MVGWYHQLSGHEFEQLWEVVKDREAWCAAVHTVTEWIWLSNWKQMVRLSCLNKTQNLARSLDALPCPEAGGIRFLLLKLLQSCECHLWFDTCLPYVSRLSGLKGKRRLILTMPAHVLYVSSRALVFLGPLRYLLRAKRFLSIKDHFWVTSVDTYGRISAIGGSVSILGQCFSNYNVDVNHLGVLLTDFGAVGLRWGLRFLPFSEIL